MKTIETEVLNKLYVDLKPIVRKDTKMFTIQDVDLVNTAFTWSPTLANEVENLEEYDRVQFFSYSYPALWKPSVEEVFVEIQDRQDIISNCKYFEVIHDRMDTENGEGNFGIAIFYKIKD